MKNYLLACTPRTANAQSVSTTKKKCSYLLKLRDDSSGRTSYCGMTWIDVPKKIRIGYSGKELSFYGLGLEMFLT
jgi:hypothetical protein